MNAPRLNAPHLHASHAAILKRLKRAEGHLRAISGMIETGRSCVELAQQLHAVEKAISEAKKTLILDHIDHCLEAQVAASGVADVALIAEFKAISRYL